MLRPQTPQSRPDPVFAENSEVEYNNYYNNYNNPSPAELMEEPYTTTRRTTKITTTTRKPVRENTNIRPPNKNNNNENTNLVMLQTTAIDSNSNLNGIINGLIQNENHTNKTVIITVVENNPQNRPINTGGNDSNGSSSGNYESRPNLNGGKKPSEQRPSLTTTTLRPNYNYGEDTTVASRSYSLKN